MEEELKNIISHLENYSTLNEYERKIVRNNLLIFAKKHKDFFTKNIQEIESSEKSVLFEVYEILSQEPENWVDFVNEEFERIKKLTETVKSKEQSSISYPLKALVFFSR